MRAGFGAGQIFLTYCIIAELFLFGVWARKCYQCTVGNGCLKLHTSAPNVTRICRPSVEHCVIAHTKSKVTGAIAIDHMCGGHVYEAEKSSFRDGCFEGVEDAQSRTHRTVCYCSSDLCNKSNHVVASKWLIFTFVLGVQRLGFA